MSILTFVPPPPLSPLSHSLTPIFPLPLSHLSFPLSPSLLTYSQYMNELSGYIDLNETLQLAQALHSTFESSASPEQKLDIFPPQVAKDPLLSSEASFSSERGEGRSEDENGNGNGGDGNGKQKGEKKGGKEVEDLKVVHDDNDDDDDDNSDDSDDDDDETPLSE